MPKGRKKVSLTLEEMLEEVTKSIEDTENSLKDLKGKKKDLEKQIEEKELAELRALIKEKNMSIADVKDKLADE